MPPNAVRPVIAVTVMLIALVPAACSSGAASPGAASPGAASPSVPPGATPPAAVATGTPAPDVIAHPTGAADVVLRAGLESGFVRMETVMGRVPLFTLYGDGRVLLVPEDPGVAPDAAPRLRETHLSEDEVQRLLRYALVDGGLGIAREDYPAMIMDAPNTVFELRADGMDKRIMVNALSADPAPGPDAAAYRAFAGLLADLQSLSTAADYAPGQAVAILAETGGAPGMPTTPWPWRDLAPADFVQPAEADAIPFPRRLLDAGEAAAAGVDPNASTVLNVDGPDGRTYAVVIRPALPEEIAAGA
jgi:hypothetical protein